MKPRHWAIAGMVCALGVGVVTAQDPFEEEPPPEEEKKSSSLQPRPDDDPKTEAWAAKLGAARPNALPVARGALLRHVLSPEGDRFYYYREAERREGDDAPKATFYALYTVGPDKSESKVADTGASCIPPLFLSDGRIAFTTRRFDFNEDGTIDALDDSALVVGNRDGGNLRTVATLMPGEVAVGAWRDNREVLISTPGEEDANGWIVSLNLVRGEREKIVRGLNVELILDDGRLLIERQQAPEPEEETGGGWGWGAPVEEEEAAEQPTPTLLDYSAHIIFDPEDGSEAVLHSPNRRARIVVSAEGSYFGQQEPDATNERDPRYYGGNTYTLPESEVLIVDDPEHHDTRAPSARFDYTVLGWIAERGLLVIEQGNLGSRLLLFDRALKTHRLAEFDLNARGFQASADGLTIGWLEVEDTDENGYLQPWKDESTPHFFRIE